jgi:outer membrane protein assembly factor BamB
MHWVVLSALIALHFPTPGGAAEPSSRVDWPTPRFVPEGTGHNPYETVLSPSTVGDLEVSWSARTDGFLYSTPVVVDDVVYATGQVGDSSRGAVYAFDAMTGQLLWRRTGSGEPPPDLTVADGRVHVGFLLGHKLRTYDAATGELLWSASGPQFAPTVVDGVVYAADGLRSLWALDAATGRRMWVAHGPLGGYGFGLAVADGVVYVGGNDIDGTSPVYAYDAATGGLVWRTNTGAGVDGTPAVARGTVYVGSDRFYALDARTGRIRWTAETGGVSSSAAVADGVVYIGSADGIVFAFEADTGEQLWMASAGGNISSGQTAIVANGVVYIGTIEDVLFAFDAATGDQLWSFQMGNAARKESVVNGTLYATSFDTNLYAFRLPGAQG